MNSSCWKSYRLAVATAAAVALLASYSAIGHRLEALLLGWGSYLIPDAEQTHTVAVVAIDAATLDEYGPWPMSRDKLATAVKRLRRFNPKALGFMLPLTETETTTTVGTIREELDSLEASLRKKAKTCKRIIRGLLFKAVGGMRESWVRISLRIWDTDLHRSNL